MSAKHIMVDLEIWDNRPTGRISQIAAAIFDESGHVSAEMSVNIDVNGYPEHRFTVNTWTVQWMAEKGLPFKRENEIHWLDGAARIQAWIAGLSSKETLFWGKGAGFDQRALEHLFLQAKLRLPWGFWQWMDARTEMRHLPKDAQPTAHDALADCLRQVERITQVWKATQGTKHQAQSTSFP
jgi:hypothetical protein